MPPALFSAGTEDLLVDDTLFMAARWRLAGNAARTDLYEGAPHGFLRFPLGAARRARDRIADFLRAQLD
jgi:acetyl esterase/lipase